MSYRFKFTETIICNIKQGTLPMSYYGTNLEKVGYQDYSCIFANFSLPHNSIVAKRLDYL